MIYGGGASAPHESEREVAEHWMTVHVTQSDSLSEFGHVTEDDEFELYSADVEGRFRVQGGQVRRFAIRDLESNVYPLAKYGSYELTGPAMKPARAIVPQMEESYYSIAVLTFKVSRDSTVTAELVVSSPNGFAPND